MTIGRQRYGLHRVDTTDANAVNISYWMPPPNKLGPSTPLVIYCHQLSGNEQIPPGYWAYPNLHNAVQGGYMVAASRAHGDAWGNDASIADILALYNAVAAVQPISGVILIGASMGGLLAALVAAKGTLPTGKLKGVYLIDPVLDLQWAYTASPGGTTNGFQATINTAYGSAVFADIPAGHDPMHSFSAAAYSGVRWRFLASTIDATVAKANNTDAFRTLLGAGPAESGLITHNQTAHVTTNNPADFQAFAFRCLGV